MNNSVKRKLKVVWLCGFSNAIVQEKIRPFKKVGEIAPWITSLIKLFEKNDTIELHIVSPHQWIYGKRKFELKGIRYYFFNQGMPVLGRNWPSFFPLDLWTNHYFVKKHVSEIIYEINPDIIHLHGAENTFHSNAILQFKNKYPVFITVQGILSNTIYASKSKHLRTVRRIKNEKMIYKTFKHFGYRTETMGKDITNLNPYAKLHWHNYPMKKIELIKSEKQFDLVYFARITKEKGIEDLLKAVAIIKKTKKNISLCVIGAGKTDELKVLANKLNIGQNVYWAGFLPTQKDVHKMASTARITVLPVYSEIISGTIVESLFLKLPVIAYDVGSIHEVNKEDEIITLVPRGDVQRLSHAIIGLLNDENQREKKADMGYKRAKEMFGASNDEIRNQLLKAYELVIHDFHGK